MNFKKKLNRDIQHLNVLNDYFNQSSDLNLNNTYRRKTNVHTNRIKKRLQYNFMSKFQKLGIAGTTINLTNNLYFRSDNVGAFKIEDILATNGEFQTNRGNYELYKILDIAMTVTPNLIMSTAESIPPRGLYILMKYADTTAVSTETIIQDENVKIANVNNTRNKTFFFKIANFQSGNNFNFKAFHDTDNLAYAISFFLYSGTNITWNIRLDIRTLFKQPKINIPVTTLAITKYGNFNVNEIDLRNFDLAIRQKEKLEEQENIKNLTTNQQIDKFLNSFDHFTTYQEKLAQEKIDQENQIKQLPDK